MRLNFPNLAQSLTLHASVTRLFKCLKWNIKWKNFNIWKEFVWNTANLVLRCILEKGSFCCARIEVWRLDTLTAAGINMMTSRHSKSTIILHFTSWYGNRRPLESLKMVWFPFYREIRRFSAANLWRYRTCSSTDVYRNLFLGVYRN